MPAIGMRMIVASVRFGPMIERGGKKQRFDYHRHRVRGPHHLADVHVVEFAQLDAVDGDDGPSQMELVLENMPEQPADSYNFV